MVRGWWRPDGRVPCRGVGSGSGVSPSLSALIHPASRAAVVVPAVGPVVMCGHALISLLVTVSS